MAKERLHYIDALKGILILLVIIHHTTWQAEMNGVDNALFLSVNEINFLIVPFFMAAFFAVTGYCANFDKPYPQFLLADVKTLLFPSVSLVVVAALLRYCMMGEWDFSWITPHRLSRFLSLHWFLPALFWVKQIHYWLQKTNIYLAWGGYLMFTVVGFYLVGHCVEYWWFYHALMFAIYLHFGTQLKNVEFRPIYCMMYIVMVVAMKLIFGDVPYVTSEISMRIWQMPLFIVSAFLGTVSIFYLSKRINSNGFLEFLGRNSIVIYCIHFTVMADYYRIFAKVLNVCNINQSLFALILLYVTVVLTTIAVSILLNKTYSKWIIGKF